MKVRIPDVIALMLVTAAIGAVSFRVYSGNSDSAEVRIESGGRTWIYPLDAQRTVTVDGPIGVTVVRIGSGGARIMDSPCPDKLCVHMGSVSRPGQWAACMPNRVFVRIDGSVPHEVDDTSF